MKNPYNDLNNYLNHYMVSKTKEARPMGAPLLFDSEKLEFNSNYIDSSFAHLTLYCY